MLPTKRQYREAFPSRIGSTMKHSNTHRTFVRLASVIILFLLLATVAISAQIQAGRPRPFVELGESIPSLAFDSSGDGISHLLPPSPAPHAADPDGALLPGKNEPGPELTLAGFYGYGFGHVTWKQTSGVEQFTQDSNHYHDWGIEIGYTAPTHLFRWLAYSLRASLTDRDTRLVRRMSSVPVIIPTPMGDSLMEQTIEYWNSMQTLQGELAPSLRIEPLGDLAIDFGGAIGIRRTTEWREGESLLSPANAHLIAPANYQTSDDGRTIMITGNSLPNERSLTLALLAGISYTFRLPYGLSVAPEVRLRYDCTSPAPEIDFTPLGVQGALRIGWSLGSDARPAPKFSEADIPKPHIDSLPHATGKLTASIDLYSIEEGGAVIQHADVRSRDVRHTSAILLPDVILFDGNETTLPARYLSAPTGDPDSAARLDPGMACDRTLAVLGARLHGTPAARVMLAGSTDTGIPPALARARAEAVRQALIRQWSCPPAQITIGTSRSGTAIPGTVRLEPSDPSLLLVEAAWRDRSFHSTPIKVTPTIEADKGIRSWDLEFRQGSTTIARKSSSDADQRVNLDMLVSNLSGTEAPAPLEARLTVVDSAGTVVTGQDQLPFELNARPAGMDSIGVGSYIAVPRGAATEKSLWGIAPLLDRVAAAARPGARIVVRPLVMMAGTDRDAMRARLRGIADRIALLTGNRTDIPVSIAEEPKEPTTRGATRESTLLQDAIEIDIAGAGLVP